MRRGLQITVFLALLLTAGTAAAQSFYFGGGIGRTLALEGAPDARNIVGFVGLESRGRLGVRLEGNETISYLFLSLNGTYTFGPDDSRLRPYAIGGIGLAIELYEPEIVTLNLGGGLRFDIVRHLRLFGEARVVRLLGDEARRSTIAPLNVGLQIVL
ncbi:MAG: hypothetical protein JSU87_09020 [Gemmatimonadota bacterium]|nr:MAG: hypothetical protein JSU87_09020 [Gemmatimonadota bacterium]